MSAFGTKRTFATALLPSNTALSLNLGGGPGFASTSFAGSDILYPGGFVGGGQIGYNWQLSPIWVVGLEADFQGIDNKESSTLPTASLYSSLVPGFQPFLP